ncbi:hypothetical protein FJV46_05840 [Arthrobacter agilis]|uniref:hypothetical protein n=1 Tax=Arthrobacter agilis TaxID=37921 RepID=UPI000B354E6F|nr:hypothetical protein [Arthrobacter agilis]OUM42273.1 hypothetical protein B8W74_09225 [Arthrobacter agilis]PPB45615.1 hypothetical protein CI784_11225 [Arthrobacter agilis]TPV26404.1 hypothetical protein FJV46_05840 [Arthrobacter agilis]VDR33703.1 Uncharacterised protein [Arthrobacter agilis]
MESTGTGQGSGFVRASRSTIGRESTTFGFSILVTVVFGLLQKLEGSPSLGAIVVYAVGAVLSFTLLEGVLSRGFTAPMPQHRTQTLAVGTSMNLLSVLAGMGAAFLTGATLSGLWAWALAPFLGSIAYLAAESLETMVGERILRARGDTTADEVTP